MVLGKRTDYGDAKYAGLEVDFITDVEAAVNDTLLCGFDFIVTPLVKPEHRPPAPGSVAKGQLLPPFSRDDVLYLGSTQWARQVVGSISSWVDPDSTDDELRNQSTAAIKNELGWAAHLGLQAVLLPPAAQPDNCSHYAQAVNQALEGLMHMALWPTPRQAVNQALEGLTHMALWLTVPCEASSSAAPAGDSWEWWNQFRTLCDYDNLLGCVLRLGKQLPSPAMTARWLGEPIKAIMVPTSAFITNKRGYPVLPKAHQDLITQFFKHNVQVILTGECVHPCPEQPAAPGPKDPSNPNYVAIDHATGAGFTINNPGESHPLRPYWEYLCYLFRKLEVLSEEARLESEYRDYLQAPLQPLQDNLESQTYEVFEKDTTKYVQYEEAVYRALLDRVSDKAAASSVTVLMVVGAGRGPIVRASMQAAKRAGRKLRVYAVEKNPNAVVHIQNMLRKEGWQSQVTIVSADMRHWEAPEQADILVSELLGSFGDNELSPECLDGAQRFLKRDGISIPQSYTSFLAPVTTHKLFNDVKAYKDREHFETPYVVKLHKHYLLAETQPMFTFEHPNWSSHIDNNRYKRVVYKRPAEAGAALLQGFAGYFETVLYKDVMLSIHPPTHTPNMFSWFPIYFPLREPVYVPAGADIEAQMWRCCGAHKVWYEWSVSKPVPVPVHNVAGRSYWVGL